MKKTAAHFFSEADPVSEVWEHYLSYHPRSKLGELEKKRIRARLAEGFTTGDLMVAIDGNHLDPFCNGENDRGKQYHRLDLILRDAGRVTDFIEIAKSPPGRPQSKSIAGKMLARATKQKEVEDAELGSRSLDS